MEYKILAKYVKDLRFFIPNADVFFLLAKNISNYKYSNAWYPQLKEQDES